MKKIAQIVSLVIVAIGFSSCYREHNNPVRGIGSDVTEHRQLEGYDRISLSTYADLTYTQDSVFYFEVSGQANILEVLRTEVRHNTLKIYFKGNVWDHHKLKITVHSPSINGIDISGSGDVLVTNQLNSDDFSATISGSGKIDMNGIKGGSVKSTISGSGSIYFGSGTCTLISGSISGSGTIYAGELQAVSVEAKVSGSGTLEVYAVDKLDATISGSGDIKYRGRPVINSSISGSGKLIHMD